MGTKASCGKCGAFFILGDQDGECPHGMLEEESPYNINEIDRLVYIWSRYSGTRTPHGKDYSKGEIKELAERLKRYADNPETFSEGFEKEKDDDKI